MLEAANQILLDLEQAVLVLSKTKDQPHEWTATTITGMKMDPGTHHPPPHCDKRAYMFEKGDHPKFAKVAFCRCQHWIIPFDSMGRWPGMPIESAAEMALWYYDNVLSAPGVDDPADLYRYGENGTIELMSPFAKGIVTATTTVPHLILWVADVP